MDDPRLSSGFDLVVIYYSDSHNFSCPQCLHVFRRARTVKQAGASCPALSAACARTVEASSLICWLKPRLPGLDCS